MAVEQQNVTLGDTEYSVVAQPIARVARQLRRVEQLGDVFGAQAESDDGEAADSGPDFAEVVLRLGDGVYDVLQAFIPDLMAKWKFHGYASAESFDNDNYDADAPEARNGPTTPQLLDAFEAAYAVNGGPRIRTLVGKTLGPALSGIVRRFLAAEMQDRLEGSLTSPSDSGSPSESSSASEETPEAPLPVIEGSPSLDSLPS